MNTFVFEFESDETFVQEGETLQSALYDYYTLIYGEDDLAKELITQFDDPAKATKVFNLLSWSDGETISQVFSATKIV